MTAPVPSALSVRGVALLPTLIIIGLITMVVVLFFNLASVQLSSSTGHVAVVELSSLRDMAVNTVIAQLRSGTAESNAVWTSQPGAVRTFAAGSGAASHVYKLYSAKDMVVNASTLSTPAEKNLETDLDAAWDAKPDVYADLNEPTISTDGRLSFPIVDPRAMDQASPVYPGSKTPEGFRYSANLAVANTGLNGVVLPGPGSSSQRLPMPVQWVYVLADGSMGVMDRDTRKFIPYAGQSPASVNNPMVGRMAFWADDETAKINLNTASEGIFWDTPRCATQQEIAFAQQPPVRNEVQRFGGHPATTSLSTVFFPGERLLPGIGDSNDKLEKIYAVAPRVSSRGANNQTAGVMGGNKNPISFDEDRLYASVDEFILTAPAKDDSPLAPGAGYQRESVQALVAELGNGNVQAGIDRLSQLRFLLTAESRAPEITASGMPRVSIWPVHYNFAQSANRRTSFDNVSAFCTTLGSEIGSIQPFHFRRNSSRTNIGEFANNNPEFSVQPSEDPWRIGSQSNGNLATYLLENVKSLRYGYARTFAEKYDNIYGSPTVRLHNSGSGIMAIMEYMRQTNLHDTSMATSGQPIVPYGDKNAYWIGTDVSGQVSSISIGNYPPKFKDGNNVLKRPTNQITTNGLGREYTLSEFGLVFTMVAAHRAGGTKFNQPLADALNLPERTVAIQVAAIFEGFCPAQGYTMIAPSSAARAAGLDRLRIISPNLGTRQAGGGIPLDKNSVNDQDNDARWRHFGNLNPSVAHLAQLAGGNYPAPGSSSGGTRPSSGNWWIGWGGSGGRWMYHDNDSNGALNSEITKHPSLEAGGGSYDHPNLYSRGYFLISSRDTEMTIDYDSGVAGRTFEVMIGNQRNGDYAGHRHYIKLPAGGITVPVPGEPRGPQYTFGQRYELAKTSRYNNPATGFVPARNVEILDPNDVVRTWVVRHGDYRMVYLRQTEGTNLSDDERLFVPHPGWWDSEAKTAVSGASSIRQIHSFTKSGGEWEKVPPTSTGSATGFTAANPHRPARGLATGVSYTEVNQPDLPIDPADPAFSANVPSGYPYRVDPGDTRDWDNGAGIAPDGAYWNKPDDVAKIGGGNTGPLYLDGGIPPYFQTKNWDGVKPDSLNDTTAPNQLMPSAVMFGSIPSATSTGLQWTTYLFRPDITPGGHLGSKGNSTGGPLPGAPPDHILLDWFWMPIVQPYAISEPFSTAGKINMNYRLAPFTHITRATGLHAVLKPEQILAIPNHVAATYKTYPPPPPGQGSTTVGDKSGWRHFVDAEKTLLQWEEKFNNGEVFMHAGEVCEQFLVPQGQVSSSTAGGVRSAMQNFWNSHRLSGDNTLERPYANIYPRLTTRSNTYRVHFLVQTITKARSTDADSFDPDRDRITGETQGDALVERSIDPNDPALTTSDHNYIAKALDGTLNTARSLDTLFSWRIRHYRRFLR